MNVAQLNTNRRRMNRRTTKPLHSPFTLIIVRNRLRKLFPIVAHFVAQEKSNITDQRQFPLLRREWMSLNILMHRRGTMNWIEGIEGIESYGFNFLVFILPRKKKEAFFLFFHVFRSTFVVRLGGWPCKIKRTKEKQKFLLCYSQYRILVE